MSNYRAGGCVAKPLKVDTTPSNGDAVHVGKQDVRGAGKIHVESQHEHGLHDRNDPLPPAATAAGWKK